jgi:hypothetical protein
MGNLIKAVLAILLVLCLFDMPYGFSQLVRFIALVGFGILAYEAHKNGNESGMFIYIGLAILFQPLLKIALGRQIWNVVDVIVVIGLIISMFMERNRKTI